MKNKSILCITAVFLIAFTALLACSCDALSKTDCAALSAEELAARCVRIHIRANSDSDADQSVKLKVRDALTAYLTDKLEYCSTKAEAISALQNESENIAALASQTLSFNGMDYSATVALKKEDFPDREYDGYTFPAGTYDSLIVYLGEGTGQNWWCVAFPPLCFVPATDDGEKIVYKSYVKELLEKIFS